MTVCLEEEDLFFICESEQGVLRITCFSLLAADFWLERSAGSLGRRCVRLGWMARRLGIRWWCGFREGCPGRVEVKGFGRLGIPLDTARRVHWLDAWAWEAKL